MTAVPSCNPADGTCHLPLESPRCHAPFTMHSLRAAAFDGPNQNLVQEGVEHHIAEVDCKGSGTSHQWERGQKRQGPGSCQARGPHALRPPSPPRVYLGLHLKSPVSPDLWAEPEGPLPSPCSHIRVPTAGGVWDDALEPRFTDDFKVNGNFPLGSCLNSKNGRSKQPREPGLAAKPRHLLVGEAAPGGVLTCNTRS